MDYASRAPTPLLIVFMDYTSFRAEALRRDDADLAETINESYGRVTTAIESSGGTVVKFIGDATLAVYPEPAVDAGVQTLLALQPAMDHFMVQRGWECRLMIKAHFGQVIAGPFGPHGRERFDVIGRTVNAAATLPWDGVTLSAEAFERCSSAVRERFKEHMIQSTDQKRAVYRLPASSSFTNEGPNGN